MKEVLIAYISYSHLIEFTLAYVFLERLYLKNKRNYLLIILMVLVAIYVGESFTKLDMLLLFVFFLLFSIKHSKKKKATYSLLIVSLAYFLEIVTTWLMGQIFLKVVRITNNNKIFFVFVVILVITFIIIIVSSLMVRKWILSRFSSKKKENRLSYLLAFCILGDQAYWLVIIYAKNDPFVKKIIFVFSAILLVLILSLIQILIKNKSLESHNQRRELEYEMMSSYTNVIKKKYQEIRKFHHDYVNILSSIEYYLDHDKIEELKQFYYSRVKQTKTLFKTNMLRLEDIQKIDSIEIKSILTTKLVTAQEKNIDVQIEVSDEIPENVSFDPVILMRLLGILLDNAIEELEILTHGNLLVGVLMLKGDVVFIIQNSVREEIEPLHQLKKVGFSTKGTERGFGLANAEELILLEPRLLLETSISNRVFTQKITIVKG